MIEYIDKNKRRIIDRLEIIDKEMMDGHIIDIEEKEKLEKEYQHYLVWESILKGKQES